ncbi:F-box protein skip23 [Thalictrum thalictroides]|uniref:F-box protein skip23 n=1 Tax=Thalictrum thalictroides TaxID=46969 RepID=A0A7J6WIC4_THATH|nr:F-box protein skip23 [Thalictrum thalictroides]
MPDWSELPEELLNIIAEKIDFYKDFLSFSAVCHPWRSVTLNHKRPSHLLKPNFPWLMLTADDEDEDEDHRSFFIPSENRVFRLNLPEARGCHCWGSPYGWLVTLGFDQQFHLLNPLTRKRLPLPSLLTFENINFTAATPGRNRCSCVGKAIITVSSTGEDGEATVTDDAYAYDGNGINPQFLLVYLCIGGYQQLVFARPGDTTWTVVEQSNLTVDVINFNGKIYAVECAGLIKVCDNSRGLHPTLIVFAAKPDNVGPDRFYLVEFGGELHLVVRIFDFAEEIPPDEFHHCEVAAWFEVFKLDLSTLKWNELETLGDYALFVGSNTTFALKASDYPDQCKPGCIYFTDDCFETYSKLLGADMGIYNLETGTFEPLYEGDGVLSRFSPPVWITPKPF